MAALPTRNVSAVNGIRRSSPPSRSRSRVPAALSTAPAPMKSNALKVAWFATWKSAADSARATTTPEPRARARIAPPSPIRMMPMFSTLWYANSRFRSCSIRA